MTHARGIDVSQYNGALRDAMLDDLEFVIARASIGARRDTRYAYHAGRTRCAGLMLGAYHFMTYGPGPTRQAETFLRSAGGADFLALDVEGPALRYPSIARAIIVNLRRLDPSGRPIGLYASDAQWPGDLDQDFDWVARWGSTAPRRPWLFWQYRGAPLDLDRYRGTPAQMRAWLARG